MALTTEDILKDIDADNVCGLDLRYDPAFMELFNTLKVKDLDQFSGEAAEPINWRNVKKLSEDLLAKTIDLNVLVAYLRALLALEGFSGLDAGLNLIKVVFEERWEHLHPQLDPEDGNDPFERVNILATLSDYQIFLKPIQQTTLIESKKTGAFNLRSINLASGKSQPTATEVDVSQGLIDGAIIEMGLEDLKIRLASISNSLDALNTINKVLSNGENFAELSKLLIELKVFLNNAIASKDGEEEPEEVNEDAVTINTHPSVKKSISGTINNNDDVIKTLKLVCEYYKKNEPSSPVPLVIERAIRLVGKNFIEVLKDLAPGGLNEMYIVSGNQDEDN